MFKITGLDKLQRQLHEAQEALKSLDGELCSVKFDPNDPGSIEAAIEQVATVIDERVARHASNPIVEQLAEQMKEAYRNSIIEKAAAARLQGDQV
ncbi:hypothetical protein [Roseateles toxinivorans]|uniref:Uncharacterized protein n=1 Tax=Roseateles toxinivorans TaxID=270368 RepID=A0A4V3CSH4_9BURK|nr:hypothetical protein [Roseateles toxinivorans]TDP60652.1 hypothetical protein DES47_11574 [Roseateles toxinivorans]